VSRAPHRGLRSLASRMALWYGLLVAVCVVTYSVWTVRFFTRLVEAELDRRAHEDIELGSRAVMLGEAGLPAWRGGTPPSSGVHEEEGGGHWLEVWSPDGRLLLRDGTT
jgi:hypothetical protein